MTCKIIFNENLGAEYLSQVWEILCECDNEFIPPLSSRESSYQAKLSSSGTVQASKPRTYFEIMKGQMFLLAIENDQVVAFMTFRGDYSCPELKASSPSNYITTICVTGKFRRKGIAEKFYMYMFSELGSSYRQTFLTTRTWSSNNGHISLLGKLGFVKSTCLADHRGKGIDTVYFSKTVKIGL